MKTKILYFAFCLILFYSCHQELSDPIVSFPDTDLHTMFSTSETVDGIIRIKLERKTADSLNLLHTKSGLSTANLDFNEICRRYDIVRMERIFPADEMEVRTQASGLDLWYNIYFNEKQHSKQNVAKEFLKLKGVTQVEPIRRVKRIGSPKAIYVTEAALQRSSAPNREITYPFNDRYLPEQWNYYNDGSIHSSAIAGADINVFPGWSECAGNPNVIVAVVDEGVQYNHPDLAANMWEGIGYNFCDNTSQITWGEGHGTHVAGIISAVNNNGIGICGIAGGTGNNDGVKIMTCEIFGSDGASTDEACAKAIKYGADHGAVISQNSWGYDAGSFRSEAEWKQYDRLVKDAIDYFITHAGMSADGSTQTGPMAGGVVIFAAGNESSTAPAFPAAYSPCISVGSISCNYEGAWYTNSGSTVDICATGGGAWYSFKRAIPYSQGYILSTLPTNLKNGDIITYPDEDPYVIDYVKTSGFGYMQGTSMACPHVSGIAALIVSKFGGPDFTNDQLKDILLNSARNIDSYQPARFKKGLGELADAAAALNYNSPDLPVPNITSAEGQSNQFELIDYESIELHYFLTNYTDVSLNDPTEKIRYQKYKDEVTLNIKASKYQTGTYNASLIATNATKRKILSFQYTIVKNVAPSIVQPLPDLNFSQTGISQILPLSLYITDPNSDLQGFKIIATPEGLFETQLSGDKLQIIPRRQGKGAVQLTATDRGGLSTTTTFHIFIDPEFMQSDFYPNPCRDILSIQPGQLNGKLLSGQADILFLNSSGKEVLKQTVQAGTGEAIRLDVSFLPAGKYLARVTYHLKDQSMVSTQTIVKY